MEAVKITIRATVQAPAEKVWACYTQPEHITGWNFASDDWQCPWATNDMRIGGKYVARMEAKDGSFGFDLEAVYEAIEPGKSFLYAMGDRKVEVRFVAVDGGTLVTVSFDAETENPVEMQRAGWQAILDNFKRYTESC
jgi:uncharacterized protein YndB with AHSA1/START domain